MPTTEPIRGLIEPTVAGDVGVWGGELNTTIGSLATILGSGITLNSSTYGTAATLTSSQAQSARIAVVNTSSQGFTLNMPSSNNCNGLYTIANNSSVGSLTITCGSSFAGIAAVIPGAASGASQFNQRDVFVDGTNAIFVNNNIYTQSAMEIGVDGGAAPPLTGVKPGLVLPFTWQLATWAMTCWDSSQGSLTANININGSSYATISFSASTANPATGTFTTTILSSGNTITANLTAVSANGTKYTIGLFGNRIS